MQTIIIIEDNRDFKLALQEIISDIAHLHLLESFENAEDAIKQIPKLSPSFVLTDIILDGKLTGIDVIKNLKPKMLVVEFLICSSYDDNDYIFQALHHGASGYILKSANISEIKNAIEDLIAGGSPMSSFIARKVITEFRQIHRVKSENEYALTQREAEVLTLLSRGLIYKEIAALLSIAHSTVKKHIRNIYEKLHVQNKIEAINKIK